LGLKTPKVAIVKAFGDNTHKDEQQRTLRKNRENYE
jgi:hypothetical protein